jgi:tetratricopeptide (TPR) repeat protein
MKITNRLERISRVAKNVLLVGLISFSSIAVAQSNELSSENPYVQLGKKALMDGDFKNAVVHLEKALPSDPNNVNLLYMIGYSEYQLTNYTAASKYFSKVIDKTPDNLSAYYYRGKSKNTEAVLPGKLSDAQRAKLLRESIDDYTKAIDLNNSDMKLYQNRGIAYRDLGNLLGTTTSRNHNKQQATEAYDHCINDLKVVLAKNPGRKDMALELKKATVYRDSLK